MSIKRAFAILLTTTAVAFCSGDRVFGQVTVTTVQSSAPAVIGYTAQPRGLFGLRTSYQPIVANVPVQKTIAVQQAPTYIPPPVVQPVTVQRAYVPAPVTYVPPVTYRTTYVPAPVATPVPTYLAPLPPTPVPVTTYYTPVYPRY
ncbi:MAG: hypothetical protein ACR2NZ_09585 [Rubripirellula sp.]